MPTVPESTPTPPVREYQLPVVLCPECETHLRVTDVALAHPVPSVTMVCPTADCTGIQVLVHVL